MNETAKKCISLVLALTLSAGLLGTLAGCDKTEAGGNPPALGNATDASRVQSTEKAPGVFDTIPGFDQSEKKGSAILSDVIWLTGEPTVIADAQFVIEKLSSGIMKLLDYSGNVLGEYDHVDRFSDGLAAVKKDKKYGYIDTQGRVVIPLEYDTTYGFSEGLAPVKKDGKWGYIDTQGRVVIQLEYDKAGSFSEGLAEVQKDGKWGYIDTQGQVVIPLEYDAIGPFYEHLEAIGSFDGLARVQKDGKWGYIDTLGQVVIPLEYDDVGHFPVELNHVQKDDIWGVIDAKGQVVLPLEYDECRIVNDGELIFVKKGASWGFCTVRWQE